MIVGIDLGSRFVKIAVYNNGKFIKLEKYDTAKFYKNFSKIDNKKNLYIDFNLLNISSKNICSTGYGRNNINLTGSISINELKAHVWGILYQLKISDFTLIDIGGQDIKIIKVLDGYIEDFIMNDKCAASTGRFIENMAKLLDVEISYLSNKTKNPFELNSTCAIFGETEIIGKISQGVNIDTLCASINYTLSKRIANMGKKIFKPPIVVSGGVSKNKAIIYFLKKFLNVKQILLPEYPQFNGAIGCVYYYISLYKNSSNLINN